MKRNLANPNGAFFQYRGVEILILFGVMSLLPTSFAEQNCTDTFECGSENGNFADPCQCRRYITCTNGAATKRVCPSGLYWDDEKLFCTYKSEAKCGPIVR